MFDFLFKKKPKQKILIFCGAGISKDSGLDTFRDPDGLWYKYDMSQVSDLRNFHESKEEVFKFYNDRKMEILNVNPNEAHYNLAKIQQEYGIENVLIYTSNIDDLLERAGCQNVIHVHGDIYNMECLECSQKWSIGISPYSLNDKCPHCNSEHIKPNIILFNQYSSLYKSLSETFESSGIIYKNDILPHIKIIIGTSFNVIKIDKFYPQRSRSILINIEELDVTGFEKIIVKPATEGTQEAYELIKEWYMKKKT